jgi:hypothetical protein
MAVLILACAAFAALDQYVGSLTRFWAHSWEVPALSAPWLLMPFAVGVVAGRRRHSAARSALLGAAATYAALVGYGLMTISPIENAPFTLTAFLAFVRSNVLWFIGGAFTGPVFGWLGRRWAVDRSWVAGGLAAGVLLLEPLLRSQTTGHLRLGTIPLGLVTMTEAVLGLVLAGYFWWRRSSRTRSGPGRGPLGLPG